jgi:hypothetical protein
MIALRSAITELGLIRRLPHGKCGDRCDEALKKQNPHGVQLAEDVSNL